MRTHWSQSRVSRIAAVTAGAVAAATLALGAAPSARATAGPLGAPTPVTATTPTPNTPLQSAWQSVLTEPGIAHALIGGYAYDVTTGTPLAAVHADWRLTPGSVTKLYASAASLADWGRRFAPTTQVAQASPGGPVYLVGGGDLLNAPLARPVGNAALAQLAQQVAAKIGPEASGVVGVNTLFGGWTSGPGWDISEVGVGGDPSVSALTSDHDQLNVSVAPGTSVGSAPVITLDPADPALAPPGSVQIVDDATTGPRGSGDSLFVRCPPDSDSVVVTGSIGLGGHPSFDELAIGDPAQFTAAVFQHDLAQDGVTFTDPASTGAEPAGTPVIGSYASPWTLTSWLREQNSWSINEMAENLYRQLGVATGASGSPADAQAALDAYLTQAGLSLDRVQVDGSGLSVLDEMSPSQVVDLLAYVAHQPYFETFEHSLIHIGRTNQCTFMCGQMDHTAADGTVWLKTGNLANQWNYAGYAHARNGDLIAFTLLFDGLQGNRAFDQAITPINHMTVDVARWPHEPASSPAPAPTGDGPLPANIAALLPAGAVQAANGAYAAGDIVSASVTDATSGEVLAQSNGETELQGGLLARLATVATFLHDGPAQRGPDVVATGTLRRGRLTGSLVLRGHRDPLLDDAQLTTLAQALAARGIRSITGPLQYVAGTGRPFGTEPDDISDLPFTVPREDVGSAFDPPSTPLAVDEDQVTLVIQGASSAGQPAQVSTEPAGAPVPLSGTVATATPASAPAAVWAPNLQAYALSGAVAPGQRVTLVVAPPDTGLVAAQRFQAALNAAGIAVTGTPVAVPSASGHPVLASAPAPAPAAEVDAAMTDPSDVTPFDMYSLLGPAAAGDVSALVGPYDQIIDPSGNGADDFLTADSIAQLLASAHGDSAEAPLVSALAAPWVVSLPERTTIAGYTTGPGGEPLAYTVMINGQLFDPGSDLPSEYAPQIGG